MPNKAPRVIGAATNMARAASAIAVQATDPAISALRIFSDIPDKWHGVIPVDGNGAAPLLRKGEVAVYEAYERHISGELVDGGLYVIEYQTPRGGMSRELFAKWFLSHGSRLSIDRKIVRVTESTRLADHWYATPIEGPPSLMGRRSFNISDGPYERIDMTDKLIGVVTGIYRGTVS